MTTPGPWSANNLIVSSVGKVPEPLALMALNGGRQDEAIANARLIAAAPELLRGLKYYLEHAELYSGYDEAEVRAAEAAVAKAEGE